MSDKIAFEPRVLLPHSLDRDGIVRAQPALAILRFPDTDTALSFINSGSDPDLSPVTADTMGDTTMGDEGIIYDVTAFETDDDTNEVEAHISRYTRGDKEATAALSDFVVRVTQKMLDESEPNN